MSTSSLRRAGTVAALLASRRNSLSPDSGRRPSGHGKHRRNGRRFERPARTRRTSHGPRGQPEHDDSTHHRCGRRLHRAVPGAGHLRGIGRTAGIQVVDSPRDRAAGERSAQNRRQARSGHGDGIHDGHGGVAARANRLVRGRDRDRREGDQGIAAERTQLRGARLPGAGDHAGAGGREPLGRQHLQPARRVELQRARQPGQLQRLAHRRDRQQRVHVQHRHRRALGRAGARVQGAVGSLLRRVRTRRRRGLGVDQVGHQQASRHGLRVPAQRRVRRAQLLRPQGRRRRTARWSRIRCRRSTGISSAARSAARW